MDPGRGALPFLALNLDTPAVIDYDALSDEKTPIGGAHTVSGNVERRIEKLGNSIGCDAFSRVSNLQDEFTATYAAGNPDAPRGINGSGRVP